MGDDRKEAAAEARAARLADALRANLKRRKAQARDRAKVAKPMPAPPKDGKQ